MYQPYGPAPPKTHTHNDDLSSQPKAQQTHKMSLARELSVAKLAVQRASRLARAVASATSGTQAINKEDHSPVTVADFGAQAVIISAIKRAFPNDKIVGEEDAAKLREDSALRARVWQLVQDASADGLTPEIGALASDDDMCQAIDAGDYAGGASGRMWALDPIDGTKGFLRGGQYAVCLALIIDSEVVLGAIGCPNLGEGGGLFSAVKGAGSFQQPLFSDIAGAAPQQIKFRSVSSTADLSFCESVEAGHSDQRTNARIAEILGITNPPIRMDSQAKYCSVSRGDGDIYLRLPVRADYEEKIWDHAAGNILVREAGGLVSDMHAKPLDFGQGRTLKNNKGVIVAHAAFHDKVIGAVTQALKEEGKL